VPPEFQTQYPTHANPPTLTMAVTAYIERLRALPDDIDVQFGTDANGQQVLKAPIPELANKRLVDRDAAKEYLRSIYPALRRHYHWFRRTQRGQIRQWERKARSHTESYRWRGRTETHVLTSGLDDYPRAKPPHVGELHCPPPPLSLVPSNAAGPDSTMGKKGSVAYWIIQMARKDGNSRTD